MKKEISIDVIIPCYNEKNTIEQVIEKVQHQKLNNLKIIVVDDYSTDGSKEILQGISNEKIKVIFHDKNYGKGKSIRSGLEEANSDI